MLDKFQKKVIFEDIDANMRVIGSPGSGKTHTMTQRYLHLTTEGILPERILTVTFSKKAASEMLRRIKEYINLTRQQQNNISTINAFCYRQYNEWQKTSGQSQVQVWSYDSSGLQNPQYKAAELMRDIFGSGDLSIFDKTNSLLKSDPNPTPLMLMEHFGYEVGIANNLFRVWVEYEKWMKENNLVDFPGQVWNIHRLMDHNKFFERFLASKFDKILCDEAQDTYPQTYDILLRLANHIKYGIEFYGDPSQSIYGFLGASPDHFINLESKLPDIKTHYLSNNYRSGREIIRVVNDFGPKTSSIFTSMLWGNHDIGTGNVVISGVESISDQADYIADEIKLKNYKPGEVFVLARTNAQCSALVGRLLELGVPAYYDGGYTIWDKAYMKAAISYLAIIENYDSIDDLLNVLNIPSPEYTGVFGDAKGKYVPTRFLARKSYSLMKFSDLETAPNIPKTNAHSIKDLQRFIARLRDMPIKDAIWEIDAAIVKWAQYNGGDYNEVGEDLSIIWDKFSNVNYSVVALQDNIRKAKENRKKMRKGENRVQVMTIHAAKGLESKTVFVTGLSQPLDSEKEAGRGFHPNRNFNGAGSESEEICLYYTAISRAIENLYLVYYKTSLDVEYTLSSFVTNFTRDLVSWLWNVVNKNGKV